MDDAQLGVVGGTLHLVGNELNLAHQLRAHLNVNSCFKSWRGVYGGRFLMSTVGRLLPLCQLGLELRAARLPHLMIDGTGWNRYRLKITIGPTNVSGTTLIKKDRTNLRRMELSEQKEDSSVDLALLTKIAAIELNLKTSCDLIPLSNWGFDDGIQEKLRQRKHRMVNQQLTDKEKKHLTKSRKQHFARSMGGVCNTVSDVLEWMSTSVVKDVQPKTLAQKPDGKTKNEKKTPNSSAEKKKAPAQLQKKAVVPAAAESSDEESGEDEPMEVEAAEKKKKPVAAVKPIVRVSEKMEGDSGDLTKPAVIEEDGDSSDGETEEVVPKKAAKAAEKRKADSDGSRPAKKTKLDKELEKFENVDLSTLDPLESRKVAMLKLQKKIEEMKVTRRGKKNAGAAASKFEEERKMKRRMSKMSLKQRKAEEKLKKKENAAQKGEVAVVDGSEVAPVKEENLPRTEDGKIVYSKFDFIVKDPKKKRLSTTEKREKFTGKDYKALLIRAEKRDEKLSKMREKEPERAKELEQEIKWNRALKKAEGVKVKDNVELLKKGLKHKEKMKEKRIEKWQNRDHKLKADKNSRQDKREGNLQKRIDDKKRKKIQKLKSKGRIL